MQWVRCTRWYRHLTEPRNSDFPLRLLVSVMTRFAHRCLKRMSALTKELEISLGPSTGDLKGRCGLHSGPVTAGVLRGEKARFQLFGDTMNTASRIESSGIPGRIHISKETASLLQEAGKSEWVVPRSEMVTLKGKGEVQTFFASPTSTTSTIISGDSSPSESEYAGLDLSINQLSESNCYGNTMDGTDRSSEDEKDRVYRLVHWNTDILHTHLVNLAHHRSKHQSHVSKRSQNGRRASTKSQETVYDDERSNAEENPDKTLIHEITEFIEMPEFVPESGQAANIQDLVPPSVRLEIQAFVLRIAHLYRDVPFHNFEHASHVTMSAGKLMKRIMNPDAVDITQGSAEIERSVHHKTYGISSDPLMQFAVVFSALIHDVDHTGYTNKELIDSKAAVASAYGKRSVAEQNSVDVAWRVLMEVDFAGLRNCIFPNLEEKQRFRQLVVNAVMATDIADRELQRLRKNRWDATFSNETSLPLDSKGLVDRKATIVFEYIIQASDVIHCMQHWLTYQKFNARLFEERYVAWMKGSSPGSDDPSVGWYDGEIWFFDNYIIPLAQKLHECGVFGVSYHESLGYAQQNRVEWERKGRDIVLDMVTRLRTKYKPQVSLDVMAAVPGRAKRSRSILIPRFLS
jgi:3'5'-cyclic nucleotide phosphodiesterase/Adenylate and Guanylate cyclase catalytic domain